MFNGILPNGIFPRDILFYWDGGPADRFKKTAFSYSNTTVANKIHNAQAYTFNGTTSAIDCGVSTVGVTDVTICAWVNTQSAGEGNLGRIFDNGRFIFLTTATNKFSLTSDGATLATGTNDDLVVGTEAFVCGTRTAAGVCNLYKNGVLVGSADQSSGTPAGATTNMFVGNNAAGSGAANANLSHVRVFSKILTLQQMGQLYNLEK